MEKAQYQMQSFLVQVERLPPYKMFPKTTILPTHLAQGLTAITQVVSPGRGLPIALRDGLTPAVDTNVVDSGV